MTHVTRPAANPTRRVVSLTEMACVVDANRPNPPHRAPLAPYCVTCDNERVIGVGHPNAPEYREVACPSCAEVV